MADLVHWIQVGRGERLKDLSNSNREFCEIVLNSDLQFSKLLYNVSWEL